MTHDPEITPDEKGLDLGLDRPCPDCGYDASDHLRAGLGKAIRRNALRWRPLLDWPPPTVAPGPTSGRRSSTAPTCATSTRSASGGCRRCWPRTTPRSPTGTRTPPRVEQDYAAQDPFQVARDLESAGPSPSPRPTTPSRTPSGRGRVLRSDGARFTIGSFSRHVLHDPMHHVGRRAGLRRRLGGPGPGLAGAALAEAFRSRAAFRASSGSRPA